jgi:predicted nucleic acid-binding protein
VNPSILDTDMLMPLFKGVPLMVERARRHRDLYGHLNITIITYYEVMKGHEYVGARDRQELFVEFSRLNNVIPLNQAACRRASQIYIRRSAATGQPHPRRRHPDRRYRSGR